MQVALLAFENLQQRRVDCEAVRRAYTAVCAQHPLFARFTDHIALDIDLKDSDLADDAWDWLSKRELRGLGLQQQGLTRLLSALPAPPFSQLVSLSVSVTGGDDHLNSKLMDTCTARVQSSYARCRDTLLFSSSVSACFVCRCCSRNILPLRLPPCCPLSSQLRVWY